MTPYQEPTCAECGHPASAHERRIYGYCDAGGDCQCRQTETAVLRAAPTLAHAENERLRADAAPCVWTEDENGIYHTTCGHSWFFDTGNATENQAKFCAYCGKPLQDGARAAVSPEGQ